MPKFLGWLKYYWWIVFLPILYFGFNWDIFNWHNISSGWFYHSVKLTNEHNISTRGLAFLLLAPLVVIGLFLAAQRTTAQVKQAKTDSDRLLADTFAKSIELLGHQESAVRQGAIYALGKIAETNLSEKTVVDVLCAFVCDSRYWFSD